MASAAGGMDIEEVAANTPEQILKETIDPAVGFRPFQARKLAFGLGIPGDLIGQAVKFMQALYAAYEQMDASLVEINPFLLTKDNRLIALDAKINFDDNAMFRHKDFMDLRDLNEEEPLEIEASKFDLNYIKARRQHRLHGERRGSGDGDDGHHQAGRRRTGELS